MNGETILDGVGTLERLTNLLAAHGVYMLFIFFSVYLLHRSRKNIQEAEEPDDKALYRKQYGMILYSVLVLAALASMVWFYATFVHQPQIVIAGTFKNLVEQTAVPAGAGDPPTLIHRIAPLDNNLGFYTSKKPKIGESKYDLDWVLVVRPDFDTLIFEFQQQYILSRQGTSLAIEDAAQKERATVRRKVKIKLAALEGMYRQKLLIEHRPDPEDKVRRPGKLQLLDDGGNIVPLPWMEEVAFHEADSTDQPFVSSLFASGVAWAAPLDMQESLFDEGRADPEVERQLVRFLGSDELKEQLLARETLIRENGHALDFIRRVLEQDNGAFDLNLVTHNLAFVIEEMEGSGMSVPADLRLLLADSLFCLGSYEKAAFFYDGVEDGAGGTASRFLRQGAAHFEIGSLAESLTAFDRYLKESDDPASRSTALTHMAVVYLRLDRTGEAIETYRQALQVDPGNDRARRVLAAAYRQEAEDRLDGAALLREAVAAPADSEALAGEARVARSGFTRGVIAREPVDRIVTLDADEGVVFYFTEIVDLTGRSVTHRWIFDGEIRAEVPLDIGGPRWRVYSSKRLLSDWAGEWWVHVVDNQGNKIWEDSLRVK